MANIKLKITETRTYSCTLSKAELLKILNERSALSHQLPADTEATVTVPSGGDHYDGDSLDLDEAGGLLLTWTETKRTV